MTGIDESWDDLNDESPDDAEIEAAGLDLEAEELSEEAERATTLLMAALLLMIAVLAFGFAAGVAL